MASLAQPHTGCPVTNAHLIAFAKEIQESFPEFFSQWVLKTTPYGFDEIKFDIVKILRVQHQIAQAASQIPDGESGCIFLVDDKRFIIDLTLAAISEGLIEIPAKLAVVVLRWDTWALASSSPTEGKCHLTHWDGVGWVDHGPLLDFDELSDELSPADIKPSPVEVFMTELVNTVQHVWWSLDFDGCGYCLAIGEDFTYPKTPAQIEADAVHALAESKLDPTEKMAAEAALSDAENGLIWKVMMRKYSERQIPTLARLSGFYETMIENDLHPERWPIIEATLRRVIETCMRPHTTLLIWSNRQSTLLDKSNAYKNRNGLVTDAFQILVDSLQAQFAEKFPDGELTFDPTRLDTLP